MVKNLSVVQEEGKEIICFNSKPILTIVKNEKQPEIIYHGNIKLTLEGDLTFSIKGETNVVSRGFNIDTLHDFFKTTLNLNSRLSKQIVDTPQAISYRNTIDRKLEMVNILHQIQDEIKDRRVKILEELKSNIFLNLEEKVDLLIKLNTVDDDLRDKEEDIIREIQNIENNIG